MPFPVEGDYLRAPVWVEIRNVLMEYWDPIGVRDETFAADEYEAYIPKIKALSSRWHRCQIAYGLPR